MAGALVQKVQLRQGSSTGITHSLIKVKVAAVVLTPPREVAREKVTADFPVTVSVQLNLTFISEESPVFNTKGVAKVEDAPNIMVFFPLGCPEAGSISTVVMVSESIDTEETAA